MELKTRQYVSHNTWETDPMNRSIALRAFFMFTILTGLAAVTGWVSHAEIAEVLFLIGGSLSALMLFFVWATPTQTPSLVRIRNRN
ncbi:hypothetical protein [Microvirga sp. 2TAF3]|uniref:hypothetical protein n=1 Tax=Microvirga sp. 2TAF3 TaxID=3233014 RepID=UPI003F980ADA